MTNASFAGNFAEADIRDQFRFTKCARFSGSTRSLPTRNGEASMSIGFIFSLIAFKRIAIEAGADLADVAKAAVIFIDAEQQRAEMISRAIGTGVPADDEVPGQRRFDLQPVVAARAAILRFAPLRDDSLKADLPAAAGRNPCRAR